MSVKKHNLFLFYWEIVKAAFTQFTRDNILTQSAALSYYTVFSLPPMLLIIFWAAGLMYEEAAVRSAVFNEIGSLIGRSGSDQILGTIEGMNWHKPSAIKSFIGIGMLLFTSSTVFIAMQEALNDIFKTTLKQSLGQSIWYLVKDRLLSIPMLIVFAFILVISLVISSVINRSGKFIQEYFGYSMEWLIDVGFFILDVSFIAVLFAIIFRYIPSIKIRWKDTWFGSLLTAILFIIGKSIIISFIGSSPVANLYQAAGSILVLMLWVYYTSAIFLFGAVVTYIRSKKLGYKIAQSDH